MDRSYGHSLFWRARVVLSMASLDLMRQVSAALLLGRG